LTLIAPIWMAFPPEVHSVLLSSGPGPGSLLAAASAWNSLSSEYAIAAEELGSVLAAVQADAWQGPSAESYVFANLLYLAWLTQASADSAVAAARHQTAAAAYSAALATMPTMPDLATNHVVHGTLLATNFFGINTIPIALNEADYVRMWVQAATTMTTYQAVASAATESAPHTAPAPQILKAAGPTPAQTAQPVSFDTVLAYLQRLGISNQTAYALGIDNIYDFLTNPVGYTQTHLISRLLTDPLSLLVNPLNLFFDGDEVFFPLGYAFLPATALGLAGAGVGSVAGLAGLAGLPAAETPAAALAPAPSPAPAVLPAAAVVSTVGAPAAVPSATPAPLHAPMASTVTSVVPPAPPAAVGPGFGFPYAVGPPRIGFDSGIRACAGAGASAKQKAPTPDGVAVAAAAAAQRQARRRRRTLLRDHGNEFADTNIEIEPDWGVPTDDQPSASGNGAGFLGFAGTVHHEAIEQAAGLTTLAGDEFGGGPTVPMMPGSWDRGGSP
jgi:PPE-repeat protein